ncbi:unnamed protein product [Rhizophagus irregularis]|nr:unnamed protein product [Rhizophagus irregularis]
MMMDFQLSYDQLSENRNNTKKGNIKEIGSGNFGKVYRANWKNSDQYLALKSFFNLNKATIKELSHEIDLHRDVDFHHNIIRFYGITKFNSENEIDKSKNYLLVMEYADGGSLRNYLKENFNNLTWENKYDLAYQLACAVSCLHGEAIVHRDLHSGNVLIKEKNPLKILLMNTLNFILNAGMVNQTIDHP